MGVALDSANVPSLTFLEDCFYRRQSRSVVVRKAIALGLGCGSVVKSAAGKAADVVVCSYINVSGGDSLLATEMSQSLTPITRNSCLSSEQQRMVEGGNAEYRTECQAAPHRYLPSVRREPFSLMEVRSSPSQDLSHYSSASSRLHCNEATNVKGFPHIMLSSRRSAPADWNMPDGHQQALHSSSFFDEKSKTKNGEDYSACSGDQPNYSAYNASLIQEYRQHQSSLPSDPASAYSQADYHHPLLPSVAGYGMYPLLQKQRPFPVKPEIGETIPWDKKAMFAGAGSSKLRPDRDSSYLKPPPVDLDEVSKVLLNRSILINRIFFFLRADCSVLPHFQ